MKQPIGGGGRIRIHGTRQGRTVFETVAIDHSAASPRVHTILAEPPPAYLPSPSMIY